MSTIGVLLGLAAAGGVVLIAVGMRASQATDATALLRERLIRQELGLGQSAMALQLERPLAERLIAPVRKAITRQMTRLTPAAQQANFQRELDFIGNPFGLDPAGVQTLRIAAAAGLGALGIAIGILIGQPFALALALAVGLVLGFYLPLLMFRFRSRTLLGQEVTTTHWWTKHLVCSRMRSRTTIGAWRACTSMFRVSPDTAIGRRRRVSSPPGFGSSESVASSTALMALLEATSHPAKLGQRFVSYLYRTPNFIRSRTTPSPICSDWPNRNECQY